MLADLSHPVFAKREIAEKSLQQIGRGIGPICKLELERTELAEVRTRLEKLIIQISESKMSQDEVRVVRVIALLERLNSPESGVSMLLKGGIKISDSLNPASSAFCRMSFASSMRIMVIRM